MKALFINGSSDPLLVTDWDGEQGYVVNGSWHLEIKSRYWVARDAVGAELNGGSLESLSIFNVPEQHRKKDYNQILEIMKGMRNGIKHEPGRLSAD